MITLSNFTFRFTGYGHYKVTYTSNSGKVNYSATINDMPLIDATKNADEPKKKDLIALRRAVKIYSPR